MKFIMAAEPLMVCVMRNIVLMLSSVMLLARSDSSRMLSRSSSISSVSWINISSMDSIPKSSLLNRNTFPVFFFPCGLY